MKTNNLLLRSLIALVALLGSITASADDDYDFTAVNDLGQLYYYKIVTDENDPTRKIVAVTHKTDDLISQFFTNPYNDYGDIVIPSAVTHNGTTYTVTHLFATFMLADSVTSITLPNTIEYIGGSCFTGCMSLQSVTIPENVTLIGEHAISGWGWRIENNHYVYYDYPLNSRKLKTLYYNARNAVLFPCCFWLSDDCEEVVIGDNVERIPANFLWGQPISSVVIPPSVTSIGRDAFKDCKYLKIINIPSGVTEIGEGAFGHDPYNHDQHNEYVPDLRSGLEVVISEMTTPPAIDATTFDHKERLTLYVPMGCLANYAQAENWRNFGTIIENRKIDFEDPAVEAICVQQWDTNGNGKLELTEAQSVTDIGRHFDNKPITKFNELGQYFTNLTSIPDRAFWGCESLTEISLPENVTTIGNEAFSSCRSLTTVTGLGHVKTIGSAAFSGCTSLLSASTASNATVGSYAFANCTSLTSAIIGANIIESNTFENCYYLASVTLRNTTEIKPNAFKSCHALTSISIPCSVVSVTGGFEDCTYLKTVTLNAGTKYITDEAFKGCSSLKTVTLPNGLQSIGARVFQNTSIETIDIPSSVTNIQSNAFVDCAKLKLVTVNWTTPLTVTASAFPDRANQTLLVPEGTKATYKAANVWKDFNLIAEPGDVSDFPYAIYDATAHSLTFYNDGLALSKSGTLIYMPEGTATPGWQDYRADITTVTFDESFTTFQPTTTARWFNGFNELTTVNGLTNLNTSQVTTMQAMFQSCFKLTQCDVSGFNTANVTNMSSMFSYCRLLPSIDVSGFNTAKVTTMYAMFQGCNVVTTLDLSSFNTAKVTDMRYMFDECSALKTIMVGSGWTTAAVTSSEDMFASCTKLVGGLGTTYNANARDKEWARVDGGYGTPGYLTDKGSPYAVLSTDGKTLTFYADGKKLQHTEQTYSLNDSSSDPDWIDNTVNRNITTVVFDASMASARPTNTNGWFAGMDKLTTITSMEYLNTSEVTNMNSMFYGCEKLTSLDLSHFNTSKVTDMEGMFNDCSSLTSLDLSSFNTSNVDIMNDMFNGCSSLVILNLSSFNTSKVTHMSGMFAECSSLVELNLNSFNTANVRFMDYLFYNCSSLTTVSVGDGWDMTHVTRCEEMFINCRNIIGELGTTYDSGYGGEDAAHVDLPDYPGYFVSADYLTVPYALLSADKKTLTLYHDGQRGTHRWEKTYSINMADNVEPGWYQDESMWEITQVVIDPSFADVRPTSTYYWFGQMQVLTGITGMEYLNTSEVTNMAGMFEECFVLTSLDVSHFDTKKVKNMADMFAGCNELTALDVSGFDTRNVTNMYGMFQGCNNLTAIDVRNFDTQKVTNMNSMFYGCNSLTSLDVSFLNTANVTNMGYMFGNCENLTSLDLRNFNTAKVTNMMYMFSGCSNMRTIIVDDSWSTNNVTQSNYMFNGCDNLAGSAGTCYNSNHVDAEYAHLDYGFDNPGYLSKYDIGLKVGGVTVNVTNMDDVLGDGTVIYNPATITLTLNNANIVVESGHAIETTADYSGTQLIIELLGQNYINSGDEDIVLTTNTFIKGPGELTLDDNSSGIIQMNGTHNLFITYGCTIRARIIRAPGFYTGSDTGDLFVTGADTRIILSASDGSEANIYGFNDVLLDEDSGLQFTYPAGAWYDKEDEYCVMCDEGEAYGVTIECPPYYAVYDSGTTTLTFYGDGQRASHNGETEKVYFLNQGSVNPYWYADGNYANVTKVVFDPSFADARPTSTLNWFYGMASLTEIVNIENLNTSEVTTMRSMFNGCKNLTSLDLSHFNTANVTSMRCLFYNCSKLTSLDVSNFNTAKVTDMTGMFYNCEGLTSLDVSNFNTAKVTSMTYMFAYCSSLTSLDLSGFDTKNVTDMSSMFHTCSSLTELDLSNFNTANVTDMSGMFVDCSNLTSLNLSSFNTENVTTLNGMFWGCSSLTELDLSSFNTAKVTNMKNLFIYCSNLKTIYVGDKWNMESIVNGNSTNMFLNCTSLVGGEGTPYSADHVHEGYAHIDGGAGNPGYFTYKPAYLLGDVNNDGEVDVADVTALTNHLLGTGGSFNKQAADVNLSGSVTTADTKIIVEYLLGKIELENFMNRTEALHARMASIETSYEMAKAELESKDSGHAQDALWQMASEIETLITALQEQLESVSSEYDVEVCQAKENELNEKIAEFNEAIFELQ